MGTSPNRVLAAWANAYADWEEGLHRSPSSSDLVNDYERIIGKLAVDPREAFFQLCASGASMEEQLNFLTECEHVQPHQPTVRYEVIQVNGKQLWTVLKWEDDHCLGGDHHWLIKATAEKAAILYEQRIVSHSATESEVLLRI